CRRVGAGAPNRVAEHAVLEDVAPARTRPSIVDGDARAADRRADAVGRGGRAGEPASRRVGRVKRTREFRDIDRWEPRDLDLLRRLAPTESEYAPACVEVNENCVGAGGCRRTESNPDARRVSADELHPAR